MAMNNDEKSNLQGGDPAHEAVEVEISFENGMPRVAPVVHVRSGGTITWRTAQGEDTPFQIVAKIGWVEDNPPSLESETVEGRQQVSRGATSIPGTYKYGILANGNFLDPDIVVRP